MNTLETFSRGTDIALLVDEIRMAVASSDEADLDLLRDACAQYAEACDAANRRLSECHRLLQRGLRSEAIQECEREPRVLDVVELLDFPEREQWCALLRRWEMAQPPTLKIDLASELNLAYAKEQSLSDLLRRHRLLALARAPLSARLALLRGIRQRDPDNPVWEEDLGAYERARLAQIPAELSRAAEQRDAEKARQLLAELATPGWLTPLDRELVNRCRSLDARLAAEWAREQLKIVEQQLNEAYAAFDVEGAKEAKRAWCEHLPTASLADDHPLVESVQPALGWLAEQEQLEAEEAQFVEACRKLEAGLDENASLETLERRYHAIVRLEREMPPPLSRRYERRVAERKMMARRRLRLVVVAVVCLLVAAAASLFLLIRKGQRQDRLLAAKATLQKMIAAQDWQGATAVYQQLHQNDRAIASQAELLAIKSQVDEGREKEAERVRRFRGAMQRAEEAGVERPDLIALSRANELAKSLEEKALVKDLRAHVERRRIERQREADDEFLKELAELQRAIKELEALDSRSYATQQERVDQARADLRLLLSRYPLASEPLRRQAELVGRRLDAIEDEMQLRRGQRESLATLVASVGHTERYLSAAQEYIRRHPETALAADLKRVVQEKDLWDQLAAWTRFLSSPEFRDLRCISPEAAARLVTEGERLRAECGSIPLAAEYQRRADLLKTIAARVDQNGDPVWEPLLRLREDALIVGIWMLQTRDGDRYYMQNKPDLGKVDNVNRASIVYLTDPNFSVRRSSIRVPDVVYDDSAPQTRVVKDMTDLLDKLAADNWESTFRKIIDGIRADQNLDPILKIAFLKNVLPVACQGSILMQSTYGDYLGELENAPFDLGVNWLDPKDEEADVVRRQLVGLLDRIPAGSRVEELMDEQQELFLPPPRPLDWQGILWRNEKSVWLCIPEEKKAEGGDLYVVMPATAAGMAEISQVGVVQAGEIRWENPLDNRFVQGRPLFVRDVGP